MMLANRKTGDKRFWREGTQSGIGGNKVRLYPVTIATIGVAANAAVLTLVLPAPASAYTDPGSGALLYQTLVAAFFGGAYYLRKFFFRWFRSNKES
jgi:hypothetical protein